MTEWKWLLPQTLKLHREARGLSMRALGAALGVSHSTVADWEHGRSYPSSFDVQRLAETLGVTICQLYGVEEGHATAGQYDREARVQQIRDAAVARLVAGHEQASAAEQEFVREIAMAAGRFRERLLDEEGLT